MRASTLSATLISLVTFGLYVNNIQANTLPNNADINKIDAGTRATQTQQQLERFEKSQTRFENSEAEAAKSEEVEQEATSTGPTFMLNTVRFSNSEYLTRDQLRQVVTPYLKQDITFNDLEIIVEKINALYRTEGIYTATANLPKQQIKDGLVVIRLVEGKLDALEIEGNDYADTDYIRSWMSHDDQAKKLDTTNLEHDILLYNRINSERLQAELRAGKSFGLTDIVIQVSEQPRNKAQLIIDNQGYESTGKNQVSALYQRQKLFLTGDRSLGYMLMADGIQSLNTSYNAPISNSRWRLGSSLTYTETNIKQGDFSVLDVNGTSARLGIESSYLAYSTPSLWANNLFAYNGTWSETEISGQKFVGYRNHQIQMGGEINWLIDQWQITGRQLFTQAVYNELGGADDDRDIFISNTKISAVHSGPSNTYFVADFEYQETPQDSVVGGSSFSIGGPTTVRGYKPGLVSGDRGFYQQLEWHYNGMRSNNIASDVYVFADYGVVKSLSPTDELMAAGIGLNVAASQWFNVDMTLAKGFNDLKNSKRAGWVAYARITCNCWN
jgi:hemolysin activation/secretion protein